LTSWACSVCGAEHDGLPLDWAFDAPAYWDGGRSETDRLGTDVCVWTDDAGTRCYFVRGLVSLPLAEGGDAFRYGAWSSLSEASFERLLELWDDPARVREPPYFGWLSNSLPGYPETLGLPVDVVTGDLELRPALVLRDADHPVVREQRDGISLERARELVELNLHPQA
jgi:hypothetical protein